jgi:hypothetical protein
LYQGALTDTSFFHALSLVLALATNSNRSNQETLTHHGELLKSLGSGIQKNESVPSASTIMAILILIGCEYRVQGARPGVIATHIRGLQAIMKNLHGQDQVLFDQVRRALFWQDVIASLVTASPRQFCLEKACHITSLRSVRFLDFWVLPGGFRPLVDFWPAGSVDVFKDLNALCLLVDIKYSARQAPRREIPNVVLMADLDDEGYPMSNSQADIEARIVDLLSESGRVPALNDAIYQACLFAAYLCTYRLSAGIWAGHFVTERCVTEILDRIAMSSDDVRWKVFPELLLWLLFVSGGLTEKDRNRTRAVVFIRRFQPCCECWEGLLEKLGRFVWCQHAMEWRIRRLWSELHRERGR